MDEQTGSGTDALASTNDKRIDAALGRLGELHACGVSAHPAIYDDIQRSLAAVLDDGAAGPSEQ